MSDMSKITINELAADDSVVKTETFELGGALVEVKTTTKGLIFVNGVLVDPLPVTQSFNFDSTARRFIRGNE
jgi:hypothetical protein